jgi:Domain of unknown function (DUF1772)
MPSGEHNMRLELVGLVAALLAASFAGVALYINVAEQPARLALDDRALIAEWKVSYARGLVMQVSTAVASGLLALAAAWIAWDWRWLAGAVAILANIPYTLIAIQPVNKALMTNGPGAAGTQTRALVEQWAVLHAGRTLLGLIATALFLWALAAPFIH